MHFTGCSSVQQFVSQWPRVEYSEARLANEAGKESRRKITPPLKRSYGRHGGSERPAGREGKRLGGGEAYSE